MDDRTSSSVQLEDRLRGWMADETSDVPADLVDDVMDAIAGEASTRSRHFAFAPIMLGAGRYVALAAAVGAGVAAGILLAGTVLRPSDPVGTSPTPASVSTPGPTAAEGAVPAGSLHAEPVPVLEGRAPSIGPSGVWFASNDGSGIARYRPGGELVTIDLTEPADDPIRVRNLLEAFGAVWVADEAGGRLLRVDVATERVSGTADLGSGTVAAGQNDIWYVSGRGLFRVDPGSLDVLDQLPDLGGDSVSIAYGADSLWIGLPDEIVRVNERTLTSEARIPISAKRLASGGDAIWAITDTELVRIDPATNTPERRLFEHLSTPMDEAIDLTWSDGRLFVVIIDRGSTDVIQVSHPGWAVLGRVSLARQSDGMAVGFGSVWIATTPDGRLWQMVASP